MKQINWKKKTNAEISWQSTWKTLGFDKAPKPEQKWGELPMVFALDTNNQITHVKADEVIKQATGVAFDAMPGGYGNNNINLQQINSLAIDNVFLGWGELSLLQSNLIINNICTMFADSMTEKWIRLTSKDESKKEKLHQLEKAMEKFQLKKLINLAIQRTILLGTAYFSPTINGDDELLSDELILNAENIKQGSLEKFSVIEPTWVVGVGYQFTNPRGRYFYEPESYIVFGRKIHATRIPKMMFIHPVNLLAPQYLWGGIPLIQNALPYILDFLNTKKQVVQMMSRFNLNIINTNVNVQKGQNSFAPSTTQAGNLQARAQVAGYFRDNWSTLFLDETEKYTQLQLNVSGVDDILQQQAEFLSLFLRAPVSKLFGQSPRGMNATGEYDANNWNELVLSLQEDKVRPMLKYALDILQLNEFGELYDDIMFEFNPLGSLNPLDQSKLQTEKVIRWVKTVEAGMAHPSGAMEAITQDSDLDMAGYDPDKYQAEPDFGMAD